jgi:GTP-binding protein Era
MIKKIGMAARQEIQTLLEKPVYLELRVKVRPNWRKDEREVKRLGYKSEK